MMVDDSNRLYRFGEVVIVSEEAEPQNGGLRCLSSWVCFAAFMITSSILLISVLYWVGAITTMDLMFFMIVALSVAVFVVLKLRMDHQARIRENAALQLAQMRTVAVVLNPNPSVPVKDDPPPYESIEMVTPPPYESLTNIASQQTKVSEVSLHM